MKNKRKTKTIINYFLDYTGEVNIIKKPYKFVFKNHEISSKDYILACKPTLDNTFKKIFLKEPKILKCFLNDILFPQKKKIKNVEYIKTEYPGKFLKNAIGSIRIDVGCKCKLIKDDNDDIENYNSIIFNDDDDKDENRMDLDINENEEDEDTVSQKIEDMNNKKKREDLIIDLEMQKGFSKKNTERFIRYISHLDVNIDSDKIWIVALFINDSKIPRSNKSSHINYVKSMLSDYSNTEIYDSHVVLEIDLNFCYKLIKEGKDITLTNQQLGYEGKEWLKLLTMPIWCDKKDIDKELFYFPNLNEMVFHQEEVKNALIILSHQDPMYEIYVKEDEVLKKELIEFNKLKENEKNHKLEIEKKDKEIKEKTKQIEKRDEIIQKLKNEINHLKKNNNSNGNKNGKKNNK